jgi:hypothetical protein
VGGGAVVAPPRLRATSGRWVGMKGVEEEEGRPKEEDHRAKRAEEEEDCHEEEDHQAKGTEEEDCRDEEARGRAIGQPIDNWNTVQDDKKKKTGNIGSLAPTPLSKSKWNKPGHETLKVNCDAAYKQNFGLGGWGYIIRDSDGDVVRARWGEIPSVMVSSGDDSLSTRSASSD